MKSILAFLYLTIALSNASAQSQDTAPIAKDSLAHVAVADDSLSIEMQQMKRQLAAQMNKASIAYFIIRVPEEKFGYTIFIDGQMYVEQKSIPAVPGNSGFASTEEADRVAQLVVEKIKEGEMPPTISLKDLDQLKIDY